jgi:CheY-like chemotaxis protein
MTKHGTILLIEDEPNDVLLVKKAFAEIDLCNPLQVVYTHTDAIRYLSGDGIYENRASFPLPFLVLLDLKIPDEGGFVVLRWLHDRPGLRKKFNVVVMSASSPDAEIQLAYELGAQSFLLKPLEYRQLVGTLRRVKEYWIDLNVLPGDLAPS